MMHDGIRRFDTCRGGGYTVAANANASSVFFAMPYLLQGDGPGQLWEVWQQLAGGQELLEQGRRLHLRGSSGSGSSGSYESALCGNDLLAHIWATAGRH